MPSAKGPDTAAVKSAVIQTHEGTCLNRGCLGFLINRRKDTDSAPGVQGDFP